MKIEKVSKKCGVPAATLRYWESIGLLPPISRNSSGHRDYEQRDLNWVFYVKALRGAGMDIDTLKKFIDSYRNSDSIAERKQILIDQKVELLSQLTKLQKTLQYLDFKIDNFDSHMIGYEEEKLAYHQSEKGENI
ncbi:MerR family transcriptional regulator [Convivina praedatoris]|uniref:HTH-type transcriptional regulator AdhR n=1 Tax=Convivina praedatoris TaxID=2880963 RepID=A0ABN8HC98_9LACO|nr:MerR family transcriptional regulator [Convivina sp. LMG 32447]CAH1851980.1 HTH-type transcriptional regulator AdhR [Convivina sp. LMG 32447]CAH1852014.1 HTH-type transcriptional regulator AdhR [Convivina sp. LMG 32447]CAH1852910.1 HTH-type transcriptional regulator AdhR [Convivina sp. LMG 32447]